MSPLLRVMCLLFPALCLSACATASKVGELAAKPLEYVGLIESSAEEAQAAAQVAQQQKEALLRAAIRHVDLVVSGGENLNANEAGQGLALVLRFYTLRDAAAFQQAPLATFTDPAREAEALAADVVQARELVLTPGQRLLSRQEIAADVNVLGVVALFRKPAPHRWRLVVDLREAARDGIVLGANACGLTVVAGLSGTDPDGTPWKHLPARCP